MGEGLSVTWIPRVGVSCVLLKVPEMTYLQSLLFFCFRFCFERERERAGARKGQRGKERKNRKQDLHPVQSPTQDLIS